MKKPTDYNVALYMRLSRDDEKYGDSVSIETQRTLLRQFVKDNGLKVVDEYVDDGWTGTNFNRPSFQKMIQDIEKGRINCVIVKDLSRFGREHIQMDQYLEFLFPEKRVRFISVTDGEDTEKGLSDFVPIKNFFNEFYAKDTSRKVKAALAAKFKDGEMVFNCPPLGYQANPVRKNTLIVDPETSWIIEKIFKLSVEGYGAERIAQMLYAEKVPTPGWSHYLKYGLFSKQYANCSEDKKYLWHGYQVRRILTNEVYIGNTVHYKRLAVSYKNKKYLSTAEDQWLRIENTHEPLVSKTTFQLVQNRSSQRRRQKKNGHLPLFVGMLRCADCGYTLIHGSRPSNKGPVNYYRCNNYAHGAGKNVPRECTPHYVREDVLTAYVLSRLQYWIRKVHLDDSELRAILSKKEEHKKEQGKESELNQLQKRKVELDNSIIKLYEDWSSNKLTEYSFNLLSQKYETELKDITNRLSLLQQKTEEEKEQTNNINQWIQLARRYSEPQELTPELLHALVDKIVIYEASQKGKNCREQKIEIFYRFIGKLE